MIDYFTIIELQYIGKMENIGTLLVEVQFLLKARIFFSFSRKRSSLALCVSDQHVK